MPFLHEWMVHHPSDWTPKQAGVYVSHVFQQLVQHMIPVNQAVGTSKVAGILLGVIAVYAQRNPLAARDICTQMATAFEAIEGMDPLAGSEGRMN